MTQPEYKPSWRKPVGMLGLLALITIWVFLIASLSEYIAPLHWAIQALIYTIAGVAWLWIFPVRALLQWMETGRFKP